MKFKKTIICWRNMPRNELSFPLNFCRRALNSTHLMVIYLTIRFSIKLINDKLFAQLCAFDIPITNVQYLLNIRIHRNAKEWMAEKSGIAKSPHFVFEMKKENKRQIELNVASVSVFLFLFLSLCLLFVFFGHGYFVITALSLTHRKLAWNLPSTWENKLATIHELYTKSRKNWNQNDVAIIALCDHYLYDTT